MKLISNEQQSAARAFLVSGMVWMAVGATFGLLGGMALAAPEVFGNVPWLTFGRVRAAHINLVVVGFVPMALLGAGLHFVPALLRTRLYSERMANGAMWVWNAALLLGTITLLLGHSQAREYADYIWPVDALIVLAFVLLLYDLGMTMARRQEPLMYVSVWYFAAAVVVTGSLFPLGNAMWNWNGAMSGVMDAILLWFYGHNVVGLLLTPLAIAAAYYLVPVITKRPLYSHTLSLVGFWTLLGFYTHIGGHHLLQAPIPAWLKVISVIDSVMMMIPVLVVLINLWLTARGRYGELLTDLSGRFIFLGTVNYLVVGIQGPLQSLPSVQRVTHFTNWTVAHAHLAVLGFAGMIGLGALWYTLPRVCGRLLWSEKLANLQFWLVFVGVWAFMLILTAGGVVQGNAWINGETVYRTVPMIAPYMQLRALFGVTILLAAYLGLYNVLMTIYKGKRIER
ncbi:MAG: cbb3-type cytochrome c oxidase subunit I [Armatimonadetes bacterium]|nr:cbb3-type cytochrome c oxidase subunit I [Armatimonadota bacterium]